MKKIILPLLLSMAAFAPVWGQDAVKDLKAADSAYDAGDKDKAEKLYLKAAGEGSAEAHYQLGYKFVLPDDEALFHFIEAAKMGHEKALGYALDSLFFRADSLQADPQKALDLYGAAKKANPHLQLFDEEGTVKLLRMCVEPKGFDGAAFMKKYGITEGEVEGYGIWELAEEASRGGRFGKPDPWLVLNLVIRGSQVPAEMAAAVEDTYQNWKQGVAKPFNLCDYITSGMGQGFCAERDEQKAQAQRKADETKVKAQWPQDHLAAFEALKKASADFIQAREENEVDLSGSGRAAFEIDEENSLQDKFQKALSRFEAGDFPHSTAADFKKADANLNDLYSRLMKAKDLDYGTVTPNGIRTVQRLWLRYREAWVQFGALRYPQVSPDSWRTWLTHERTAQLADFGMALHWAANGTAATFRMPYQIALDPAGNLYVADYNNNMIRKITPNGEVTTLAGSGAEGSADGRGTEASFKNPGGVAVDSRGNVYVADTQNVLIRKITPDGRVTTLAGSKSQGSSDGKGAEASFRFPTQLAVDSQGNVYVTDGANCLIRKISPDGLVTTLAGSGAQGSADGIGRKASFYFPEGIAVDAAGNLYVSDEDNQLIRKITPEGDVTTLAGRWGHVGSKNGESLKATFNSPNGLALDPTGNIYVCDQNNNLIRKVTPKGLVSTLAGQAEETGCDNGPSLQATFNSPSGIAVDSRGNVYVADSQNNVIRKITKDGVVSTFAGMAP